MTDKLQEEIARAKSQLESGDYDVIDDVETHQSPKDKTLQKVKEGLEALSTQLFKDSEDYFDGWANEYAVMATEALTTLNSYIEARDNEGWQPIKHAPINKRIILTFDYDTVYTGAFERDGIFYDGGHQVPDAIAWMPLPKAEGGE